MLDPTPAPQARPVEQEVAEVIAAHREDCTYPDTCLCEIEVPDQTEGHYAAHLAAALAPLIARERDAAAREAWQECTDAHHAAAVVQGLAFAHPANPYRADRIGGERRG